MALELFGNLLLLVIISGLAIAGVLTIQIWKKNLATKVTYLRFVIQMISVTTIYYIYTLTRFYLFIILAIFLATIFLGRFFCGWICPFGFYMDLTTAVRKALSIPYKILPQKLNKNLNRLRYVILGVIISLPIVIGGSLNNWTFFSTIRGAYRPLMLLLAPIEPLIAPWQNGITFNGINFGFPYVSDITHYGTGGYAADTNILIMAKVASTTPSLTTAVWIGVIGFVALMVASSFLARRLWCRFCPSGASASCLNRFGALKVMPVLHIDKDEEKCTKCGICQRVCPVGVTEVYEQKGGKIMSSMCLQCYRCVEMCPYEDTLKVKVGSKTVFKSRNWLRPANLQETKS
jgi:ferredoxin-type protein NapH